MKEMLEVGDMVLVTCDCPCVGYYVEPRKVGRACMRCHKPQRRKK